MPREEGSVAAKRHRLLRPLPILVVVALLATGAITWLVLGSAGRAGNTESAPPSAPTSGRSLTGTAALTDSPTIDAMRRRGGVIVGVKEDQPRFGYKDPTTGRYSGFDIEIAKLIAGTLGFAGDKITFKTVTSNTSGYGNREQRIANGEVDYYVGTYTIVDKRKQQVSFAGPYYLAGQDLLVRADDTSITGKDTLKGKKVCSVTGSTPIQRVRDQNLTEPDNIIETLNYRECVVKLLAKDVDALTTDDSILRGYALEAPDKLKLIGKPFSEEPYGVGLRKDDKVLRDAMNGILQTALDDGTWQSIYDNTLGTSGPPPRKPTIQPY